VHWPTGEIEEWPAAETRRYHTLVKGRGRPVRRD
jgi:hypothetical protein